MLEAPAGGLVLGLVAAAEFVVVVAALVPAVIAGLRMLVAVLGILVAVVAVLGLVAVPFSFALWLDGLVLVGEQFPLVVLLLWQQNQLRGVGRHPVEFVESDQVAVG